MLCALCAVLQARGYQRRGACPCRGSSRLVGPHLVMPASWVAGQGCLGSGRMGPPGIQYLQTYVAFTEPLYTKYIGCDEVCASQIKDSASPQVELPSATVEGVATQQHVGLEAYGQGFQCSQSMQLTNNAPLLVGQLLIGPEAAAKQHSTQ